MASETGQGRVEWPPAFVAPETLAVPGLVDGHQVVTIDDFESATGANDRCRRHSRSRLLLLHSCGASFVRELLRRRFLRRDRFIFSSYRRFISLLLDQMLDGQELMTLLLLEMMIKIRLQHRAAVADRLMLLNHFRVGRLVVVVVVVAVCGERGSRYSRRPSP